MVFSSFLFLFVFLPLVLIINHFLPIRASNVFLLVMSLAFYAFGEGSLVLILVISILWNYIFGISLSLVDTKNKAKRLLLYLCIIGNLGLLFYYKYIGLFITSFGLNRQFDTSSYTNIILPIGISFFTFQGISYIVDIYRKTEEVEWNPLRLGLYIAFFPQLIAGPIIKYNEIAQYFTNRIVTKEGWILGSFTFIRGLAKKVIFADSFGFIADTVFESNIGTLPAFIAWVGILFYSFQIYFDFSGYSDMAIGLGRMLGFKIPINFNYPYASRSIQEFWRRWHISLSTWFRDYLYIPLGGNRKGKGRLYVNLILIFIVTGLWHGANISFVIWGLIHGAFLIIERQKWNLKIPRIVQHIYTCFVVLIAWVFFRLEDVSLSLIYIRNMFNFDDRLPHFAEILLSPYIIFLFCISIPLSLGLRRFIDDRIDVKKPQAFYINMAVYFGLFIYCISELTTSTYSPFIYFKF